MILNEREEKWINFWEGIGVAMRILAFGVLSIMNKDTPFLAMWIVNTIDAVILTYCAWRRGNKPYMALNLFWLLVGIVGIYNSWE
jgi:phosphoglycerol transferase MdoB-like AlkP superfamily enzyme